MKRHHQEELIQSHLQSTQTSFKQFHYLSLQCEL